MADDRRFDLEDILVRPGTYFNPQTEVLVIVDDSTSLGTEPFENEALEGADWVLVSDELPVDEPKRDELLEEFGSRFDAGDATQARAADLTDSDDERFDEDENSEPEEDEPESGAPDG